MEQQNSMNIQWYPGHMTKTRRMMEEDLKLVDAVCEILDARIPISSRNPDIDAICGKKPRMVILNRIDMADPDLVSRWSSYFKAKGMAVIRTDCKSRRGINTFAPTVRQLLAEKLQRYGCVRIETSGKDVHDFPGWFAVIGRYVPGKVDVRKDAVIAFG